MGKKISLNARTAFEDDASTDVAILLVRITHPAIPDPVLISTDPTVFLSRDPLVFGTRHQGEEYLFVGLSAVLPSDEDKSSPKGSLVLDNVSSDLAKNFRSVTSPANVEMRIVLASTVDNIEILITNMQLIHVSYDATEVSLDISREPFTSEPMPAGRMTMDRFPGLF